LVVIVVQIEIHPRVQIGQLVAVVLQAVGGLPGLEVVIGVGTDVLRGPGRRAAAGAVQVVKGEWTDAM
jgi:hypothetical protein